MSGHASGRGLAPSSRKASSAEKGSASCQSGSKCTILAIVYQVIHAAALQDQDNSCQLFPNFWIMGICDSSDLRHISQCNNINPIQKKKGNYGEELNPAVLQLSSQPYLKTTIMNLSADRENSFN